MSPFLVRETLFYNRNRVLAVNRRTSCTGYVWHSKLPFALDVSNVPEIDLSPTDAMSPDQISSADAQAITQRRIHQ